MARDAGLVLLSSALLLAAFMPLEWWWLAWVGLIPFLIGLRGRRGRAALGLSLLSGTAFHVGVNYWIAKSVFDVRDWLHYSTFQGVLVGGAACVGAACTQTVWFVAFGVAYAALSRRWSGLPLAALTAAAWWSYEYLRTLGPVGYTWGNLAYSQWRHPLLLQICDLAGVYLLSAAMVFVSAAVVEAALATQRNRRTPPVCAAVAVVVAVLFYGAMRLPTVPRGFTGQVRVRGVQSNVPGDNKLASVDSLEELDHLAQLTESQDIEGVDLVVWPETALSDIFPATHRALDAAARLARQLDVDILTGSFRTVDGELRNSAALLTSDGRLAGWHDKAHLVPFGEYTPLRKWLPFMSFFTFRDRDFSPGPSPRPLPSSSGPLGCGICFESIFPQLSRLLAQRGARALVIITNDDWYIHSTFPHEHAVMAVLRAVETRRDIVRVANTGVSCIVRAEGRMESKTAIRQAHVFDSSLRLRDDRSLYLRWGDAPSWLAVAITLLAILTARGREPAVDERTGDE